MLISVTHDPNGLDTGNASVIEFQGEVLGTLAGYELGSISIVEVCLTLHCT